MIAALIVSLVAGSPESLCEDKCTIAGHCCQGPNSACQKPSCAMGCIAAITAKQTEAQCNATW